MQPIPPPIPQDPQNSPPANWLKSLLRFLWELTQTVLLATILFSAINLVTTRIQVRSISMQPTLYESDRVLVNRLAYKLGTPTRKDVIVFDPLVSNIAEPYIKRIIGLPGDVVRISHGQVYVNNLPLQETYLAAPPAYHGSWTIPAGHVFVLGDNRNNSFDSHYWGVVALDSVIGKAEFVYWPLAHLKLLNPARAAAAGQPNP